MALHLVTGGSGSGKSFYVYNKIMKQSFAESQTDFLVIVPEQFTMQTQKDMVMLSKAKGIMNIDVLSFMRLAYRVLEQTPALNKPVLEDEGKGMIIRRILREHAGEWKTFGSNINRPGFVEEIKSIVTEFVQYRMTEDALDELEDRIDGRRVLVSKLDDLALVYKYYTEYMDKRYISAEEILELLTDYASESKLLQDSVICIDGFTGLTPVQYVLLGELLKVCRDVYITVTIDNDEDFMVPSEQFELFYMSKCYINKVLKIARDNNIEIADVHRSGRGDKLAAWRWNEGSGLAVLERNLYRRKKVIPEKNEDNDDNPVHIYEAVNPYEEAEYIVWKIRQLIKEKNYRYRDMAIVTGDMNLYGRLLHEELKRADIPCFIDNNKSVLTNALVDMIRALAGIADGRYMPEAVISFLRNGLVRDYLGFEADKTDILENYLIATGIKGAKRWKKEWSSKKADAQTLQVINEYRVRVIELAEPIMEEFGRCKTVLDYSRALYTFLADNKIDEAIDKKVSEYEQKAMPVEKKEYEQIYGIVVKLIDQMATLMGDEKVTLPDYTALLETGFSEASVGIIPPGLDCIMVGDIERTRLKDIKILFFAGVNDGTVPKAVKQGGFLSDIEREFLLLNGAELAPTTRERIFNERFYLYLNVTKPSEELYLSYSRKGNDGNSAEPSSLISQIMEVTGEIPADSEYRKKNSYARLGNDSGKSWWIEGLRRAADTRDEYYNENNENVDKEWLEIHRKWMSDEEGKRLYDKSFYNGDSSSISAEIAQALYGRELVGSVSRLELFAGCRFAHFLKYGLGLKKRPEFVIDYPDVGILFHSVVENFSRKLDETHTRWQDTDSAMIEDWVREITDKVCDDYGNGIMKDNARNEYIKERVFRISSSTVDILAGHMKKGSFEAYGYELSFSRMQNTDILNIKLNDGNVMHLTGRIDRLDTYSKDDCVYVKVIDYKSGNKKFDLSDVYYGLDMQLIVYLTAAESTVKEMNPEKLVIPAGAFYFHIDDPVVTDLGDEEANKKALEDTYRMEGPVNSISPVPYLIDNTIGDENGVLYTKCSSNVIRVATTSAGSFDAARSVLVDNEKIRYIKKHVSDTMEEYGNKILAGDTSPDPYKQGKTGSCDYCEYKSICGFDARLSGNSYRHLEKLNDKQIWEELKSKYESTVHTTPEDGD